MLYCFRFDGSQIKISDLNGSAHQYETTFNTEFHCHSNDEIKASGMSDENKIAMKKLGIGCVLVGLFMVCEVIGGYLSGSLAIMGDAAHMFSDLAR